MRYLAGCRCRRCRRGNSDYEAKLARDRKLYGPNDLVATDRVLAHLAYLRTFGMGHKTVARIARVAKTGLAEMIWYDRRHIRRRSEARVLAVLPLLDNLPRNAKVDAGPMRERISRLIRWGYPKGLISTEALGNDARTLQCGRSRNGFTIARTSVAIRNFDHLVQSMRHAWEKWRGPVPARHFVYWKKDLRGRRPKVPTVKSLELRPFAGSYDYFVLWPDGLKEASRLKNRIKRFGGKSKRRAA